jgi:hypothetical protein
MKGNMKKKKSEKNRGQIEVEAKPVIWVAAAHVRRAGIKATDAIPARKAESKLCKACGHNIPPGRFSIHTCQGITATVGRVRKKSSLPRKQRFVKVKSEFQEKLSDYSGGKW